MSIWRTIFGCTDFEHFAAWCPGCFGIMVGFVGCALLCGLATVVWVIL